MFIISIGDQNEENAYSVLDEDGEPSIFLFQDEDDAIRFSGLLEADGLMSTGVIQVDPETTIKVCEMYNYHYSIVKPTDFVIPLKNHVEYSKNKI